MHWAFLRDSDEILAFGQSTLRRGALMTFPSGGPILSHLPRLRVPIVSTYRGSDADFHQSACACFFASESVAEKFPEKSLAPVSSIMWSLPADGDKSETLAR